MADRLSLNDPSGGDELGARFLSSAILMPLALGAVVAGGPWLAGAAGAAIVAMSFEWSRMSEPKAPAPAWALGVVGALGAVMLASWGDFSRSMAWLALWACVSALRRRTLAGVLEAAGGVVYIGTPCVAFIWLHAQPWGRDITLSLFAIIWTTDIAAYFGGRFIGGPAVAPAISPQKTWAGTLCGVVAGLAAGVACGTVAAGPTAAWALFGFTMGACGLAGDLLESFLKRRFGVKDSSRLIPGHGGVLDRVDSLMLSASVAALVLMLAPSVSALLWGEGP